MKKPFDELRNDLLNIEMNIEGTEVQLSSENERLDQILRKNSSELYSQTLTDDQVERIWQSTTPGELPISLNTRVKNIFNMSGKKMKPNGVEVLPTHTSFALAFRKEEGVDKVEQEKALSAIERARAKLQQNKGDKH